MDKNAGFYTFYYDKEKGSVFIELNTFEQAFIFQSSMPRGVGSNDLGLDRGKLGDTRLVQFERYGEKVLLKQLNTYYQAHSSNAAERQSISEAFASSVIDGFKVVANTNNTVLIDYTDFLLSDIQGAARSLERRKQGSYSIDAKRSAVYPKRSKSFLQNTEFEALVTFKGSKPGEYVRQVAPDPYSLTVHMHHSFIKLPDDNYTPRAFSPNSGMMPYEVKDYASAIDAPMEKRFIPRHRLQKKNKNAAVSAPVKPIIYYLDPGVPEPVRSALLDGASWWNEAFEAIGFKNAYQVKILPVDADPMDVRYNVIQWVHRATRGWSYGSSVVDPRTGEIIKGHVTLGSLRVRQDLLIAQGMTSAFDGQPQKLAAAKNMALDRIRQLSAHEVGHTLGIAHNFAASASNRASVMDYPHPLITMDNNGDIVLNEGYDKGIGDWDKFVVAYGYSEFTGDEKAQLDKIQAQAKAKGLMFISDQDARPIGGAHPAAHLWDNGKDPVDELNRLIEVRSKALAKFGLDSLAEGVSLSQLQEKLVPIYLFHRYQTQAAVKLIAGVDYSYELKSNGAAQGSSVVAPNRQKAALNAILATLDSDFLTLPEATLKLI
ncbi:MAG: zinc-dependent metalloprotease, partial [Psychrosphaera sp.]|nr:zinc-dependent metalloprotease [Psychrosphaera sp.]